MAWHDNAAVFTLGWFLQCSVPQGALEGPVAPAASAAATMAAAPAPAVRHAVFGDIRTNDTVAQVAQWAVRSDDTRGLPFIIVDKREAAVWVFDRDGRARGRTPVLLGLARGDDSVPGIGERAIADIRPEERTTPAGRFVAQPGRNSAGEEVLWVDYQDAISMHRVRVVDPRERRLHRLASPSSRDNRISYGCINVPVAFFDQHIAPAMLQAGRVIVYVLPEVKPLGEVLGPGPLQARAGVSSPRRG